jgi:acyl-CoA synthetase (AMP-forming)/AMP-acid ligase II
VLPHADLHTPYGMTEALPLTDVSLTGIVEAGDGDGVCVGTPLAGVQIRIAALDPDGRPADELTAKQGVTGEIWARAAHIRHRYDSSWVVDLAAHAHPGWHRTGDVGYLDERGRLWIQGRSVHVITTASGPVTPVGIELRVESRLADALGSPSYQVGGSGYPAAAAVGVGPAGTQQVVVVLEGAGEKLAPASVTESVRSAAGVPVAAVLVTAKLPVDIRHNSKIDRAAVSRWATGVLAAG